MGPLPGTKWEPSLGQTGLSLFNSTVKSLFCPGCPWDGWGFVPGTIAPQGPSGNCLCDFCLLVFLAPILIFLLTPKGSSWWTFRIFFIFSARGRGRGRGARKGLGGVSFLLTIPGGGSPRTEEEGGGRGAGMVSAGNLGGGGLNIFFSGPKCPKGHFPDFPFLTLDGPIRANRFADSCKSPDSRESFQGSRTEPLFLRIALKLANRRFEAIRANRSHVMKIVFFSANRVARIDSLGGPS